jgi:excisionase family DNA binding protein
MEEVDADTYVTPTGHKPLGPMLANFEVLPEMLTAKDLEGLLQIDRKTIYRYVQLGLIPYLRMESNLRFSKRQVQRWLEERSFQPRPVNGKGARLPMKESAAGSTRTGSRRE